MCASGCADSATKVTVAAHPYRGPLHVRAAAFEHPDAGAAGNVVDCFTWGGGEAHPRVPYNDGATADSSEQALQVARHEGAFGIQTDLQVAKDEGDRVLYVFETNGVPKQAVIVHNGPATEGAGGPGWYVESWAMCDYSEFPRSVTDAMGLQIWTDPRGTPISTKTIQSRRGPKHCDWESMTFLALEKDTYVRDPLSDVAAYFAAQYRAHAQLPHGAIDTGFERDGQHLWLSADKQSAYVGTATDVEAWPREIKPLLCA